MNNIHLEITGVNMDFPTPTGHFRALENVNLKVEKGEFVSIIGHSGCGKSTVLNIVAGLYNATAGGVILNGKEVVDPGPERAMPPQWRPPRRVSGRRWRRRPRRGR